MLRFLVVLVVARGLVTGTIWARTETDRRRLRCQALAGAVRPERGPVAVCRCSSPGLWANRGCTEADLRGVSSDVGPRSTFRQLLESATVPGIGWVGWPAKATVGA